MNDKWIKNLKALVDGYEQTPPQGLLDDIKREMAARGVVPADLSHHVAHHAYLWHHHYAAAAIGVLLVMGAATIGYMAYKNPVDQHLSPIVSNPSPTSLTPRIDAANTSVHAITERLVAVTRQVKRSLGLGSDVAAAATPDGLVAINGHHDIPASGTDTPLPSVTGVGSHSSTSTDTHQSDRRNAQSSDVDSRLMAPTYDYTADFPRRKASTNSKLGFAAYYGGMGTTNQATAPNGSAVQYDSSIPQSKYATLSLQNIDAMLMAEVPPQVQEKHHRPIKMGISVSYPLNDRWSLRTGVTYSRLSSEFISEGETSYSSTRQKLHYIGIPVGVNYNLWANHYAEVYVTAGAEIEKLVRGRAEIQSSDGGPMKNTTEKVSEHRPVFSTTAAAGVAYKPVSAVSIFVEPGVVWSIKNGSGVHSAYTDKPANFHLNMGVRINVK